MKLGTITMNRYDAAEKARHFDRLPAMSAEDVATQRGYRALAKGAALIDLRAAFRSTGLDEQGRPMLCIAAADAKWGRFKFNWPNDGGGIFYSTGDRDRQSRSARLNVTAPPGTFPRRTETGSLGGLRSLAALAPSIPPEHRPAHALSNYHLLWEAEWRLEPPGDPFLLRHLAGSLYVVLAQWDLTAVEQAVLAGRLLA